MLQSSSPFADEFRAFAEAEALSPAPRNALLFYGSSSICFWSKLAEDFSEVPVVNRGFGGSTLAECVEEMERLVFPLHPKAVVLYAGENDLDHGTPPERVASLFREFASRLGERFGLIPLVFISIKPSPSRAGFVHRVRRANALVRETLQSLPNARFVDVFPLMLDQNGQARRELFTEDLLHLSRTGYLLWREQVRACLGELCLLP